MVRYLYSKNVGNVGIMAKILVFPYLLPNHQKAVFFQLMSIKNKQTPNKAEELFYRASLREAFRADVLKIRTMFGIPGNGFKSAEAAKKWLSDYISNKQPDPPGTNFFVEERNFLIKHRLPLNASTLFHSHILLNGEQHIYQNLDDGICEIDDNVGTIAEVESPISIRIISPTETKWHISGQSFVKLFISASATPTDVQRYIKNNWSMIQEAFKKQLGNKQLVRVRMATHKKRDENILELYSLSRQELGLRKGQYKDIAVASRMAELGYKVTPENVRKIISRQKKLRSL